MRFLSETRDLVMNEKRSSFKDKKYRERDRERVLTDDGVSGSLMVRGNDIPTEELISDVQ